MKLTFDHKAFTDAFGIASAAAPSRTTKEVLKNVLLSVAGGRVALRSTDGEVGVEVTIPDVANIDESSVVNVLLPRDRVQQILREITDETISLIVTKEDLQIVSGASEFRLLVGDPFEFPKRETIEAASTIRVTDHAFRKAMTRTVFACDIESTRYALGGVLFELDKTQNRLWLVATDSRRLAVSGCSHSECLTKLAGEPPIVPSRAVGLMLKTLSNADEEVTIGLQGNSIQVSNRGTVITSQLVQGRFPQWAKVLPPAFERQFTAVVKPLMSAVKQAAIATTEETAGVDFAFRKGNLRLSSGANDLGSARIDLPIAYDGDDLTICLDPRWLLQMLANLDPAAQITMKLNGNEDATLIETDDGYRYVIMPLSRDRSPSAKGKK